MNALIPSFSFDRPDNQAFPRLKKQLSRAGLRVMQTFDLRLTTPLKLGYCPCPHHAQQPVDPGIQSVIEQALQRNSLK